MAIVFDIAKCIISQTDSISAAKLQKLVYYCQAWHLVWEKNPLFDEPIEAWHHGPIVPYLHERLAGKLTVSYYDISDGQAIHITLEGLAVIRAVLDYYGHRSAQWLIDLARLEDPWRTAYSAQKDKDGRRRVITHSSMAEYYGGLWDIRVLG